MAQGRSARSRPRVGLMVKRSAYRLYVEEQPDPKLRRLVDAQDDTVMPLRASHEEHEGTVREVKEALDALGAEVAFVRYTGEPFDATGLDLVVTVGGDGTLLSASHHVDDVPILAINSAPSHSVGFFCGAKRGEAAKAIAAAMRGTLRRTVLTRMQVSVDGELISARVLNDALFC